MSPVDKEAPRLALPVLLVPSCQVAHPSGNQILVDIREPVKNVLADFVR